MVRFWIPGEPVAKGRPRLGKGRTFTPKKTRDYEENVRLFARQAMCGKELLSGALRVVAYVARPIPKSFSKKERAAALLGQLGPTQRPDCDNFGKGILDGMNSVIYQDDSAVVSLEVVKLYGAEPGVLVEVSAVSEELRRAADAVRAWNLSTGS